eukprot:955807-Rhodomonas_salina.1
MAVITKVKGADSRSWPFEFTAIERLPGRPAWKMQMICVSRRNCAGYVADPIVHESELLRTKFLPITVTCPEPVGT